jgi:geranylgeranyl diphosphate synthase type II
VTVTTSEFLETLDSYGDRARRAAAGYLPGEETARYLTAPVGDYLGRKGKGLRPALCMATCEAFGGTAEDALPSAAAIELLHTAFLVHDDVEDESELRRGEPTLHLRYGRALAINAGDGLALYALSALRENERVVGRRLASRIWSEFEFMARHTVEGQAIELGWQRDGRLDLTPDDYLDLIMKKTCWYTTVLPLRVGSIIGRRKAEALAAMLRFGFFLGAAFQIQDDILNLTAPSQLYGKERFGDIREGKRTLILMHLLTAASPSDRSGVERFLASDRRSEAMVEDVFGLMDRYGSVSFAEEFAWGIARSAEIAFEEAFAAAPPSPARSFLSDLIPYMVQRDH